MNKKIMRGSLAGVAVIALAAGGSTFASWSDSGNISAQPGGGRHPGLTQRRGRRPASDR